MEKQAMADSKLTADSIAGYEIPSGIPPENLKALCEPVPYRHDSDRKRGNGN